MEQNYGCVLEESLAGCLGWRNAETGWLVLNDLLNGSKREHQVGKLVHKHIKT